MKKDMNILETARSYAKKNERFMFIKFLRVFFGLLKRRELEVSIVSITSTFPEFVPYSAGSYAQRARCTVDGIKSIFPALLDFTNSVNSIPKMSTCSYIQVLKREKVSMDKEVKLLGDLFRSFGSDKSTLHDYHTLYANLFDDRFAVKAVLEIGLGSNNSKVLSNMGRKGTPGASVRAFSSFFPNSTTIGLDYDRSILFSNDRIKTYFVNQLDPTTFDDVEEIQQTFFDLIIDDGLHLPTANLISMFKLLKQLRPGGWFIVEDIGYAAADIWRFVMTLFPSTYSVNLIETKSALVLAVNRKQS